MEDTVIAMRPYCVELTSGTEKDPPWDRALVSCKSEQGRKKSWNKEGKGLRDWSCIRRQLHREIWSLSLRIVPQTHDSANLSVYKCLDSKLWNSVWIPLQISVLICGIYQQKYFNHPLHYHCLNLKVKCSTNTFLTINKIKYSKCNHVIM